VYVKQQENVKALFCESIANPGGISDLKALAKPIFESIGLAL
jgi:O-acetylhomoserine/O-acetylserine sulfhydrylase-like pyridoxal-dependent enzyme